MVPLAVFKLNIACYVEGMTYRVAVRKTDEGYSVSCPGLPGCWSQGETEQAALENIRAAIADYLAARDEMTPEPGVRQVEITV